VKSEPDETTIIGRGEIGKDCPLCDGTGKRIGTWCAVKLNIVCSVNPNHFRAMTFKDIRLRKE